MTETPSILYCHCAYAQVAPPAVKAAVLGKLCEAGLSFTAVADLCELSARQDPALARLAAGPALKIVACHPRAVKWLFAAAQAPLPPDGAQILNMRELSAAELTEALLSDGPKPNVPAGEPMANPAGSGAISQGAAGAHPATSATNAPAPSAPQLALRQSAASQPLAPADRCALLRALLEKGCAVTVAFERRHAPADGASDLLIEVSLPAARPELPAPPGRPTARFQDISGWPISHVIALVEAARAELNAPKPGDWQPWFPVIDYDRCTNCLQCLSFCLFGVFGVDAQRRVRVEHAESCKNNCPACARVCPEAAIIFPKYKAGPINGQEAGAAEWPGEKMKVDISALLGGDIYSVLRERGQRAKVRFSKERDPDAALLERQRCLRELAQLNGIPPEVLMALPSPAELPQRAAEAIRKAAALRESASAPSPQEREAG